MSKLTKASSLAVAAVASMTLVGCQLIDPGSPRQPSASPSESPSGTELNLDDSATPDPEASADPVVPVEPPESAEPAPEVTAPSEDTASEAPSPADPSALASSVSETTSLDEFLAAEGLTEAKAAGDVTVVGSVHEAKALTEAPSHIVISDDVSHVRFDRDASSEVTLTAGGQSYGALFRDAVELLAYDLTGDASPTLESAVKLAASQGKGVALAPSQTYRISKVLKLPDDLAFLDGRGATIQVGFSGAEGKPGFAVELAARSTGTTVRNVTIDLSQSTYVIGVFATSVRDVVIDRVNVLGVTFRAMQLSAVSGDVDTVTISGCRIENVVGDASAKGQAYSIMVEAAFVSDGQFESSSPIWDRYTATGRIAPNLYRASNVVIENNQIIGGYYGISFSGASNNIIRNNFISMNMRNISMQNNSSGNLVEDNYLSEAGSTGVHTAYNSDNNLVQGNTVVSSRASGQALLQSYQASDGNVFRRNFVTVTGATPQWLMYVATDSINTVFEDNVVSGAAKRAMIGVESVWDANSALADGKNPQSYMAGGSVVSPVDGSKVSFNGGFGPLTGVRVLNNVVAGAETSIPLVYVGAESSLGRAGDQKVVGNVSDLAVTGNQAVGRGYSELVKTHEGGVSGVSHAKVTGSDLSFGAECTDRTPADGGSDVYALADVTLPEVATNVTLLGAGNLAATGTDTGNELVGNVGANMLDGGFGDDRLRGGEGADILTGGAGADTFAFEDRLDGTADVITDFEDGVDTIHLSSAHVGQLRGAWFAVAGQETAESRIIRDGDMVYFDPDGSGALERVAIVQVTGDITAEDFS